MESLGEKIKNAREKKGISFDQASKDTKISIRYLEALEKENFASFPGEAYIIGFLRNYGAYLEIDVQELLSRYRALIQQEQPIPEQLLKHISPVPKIMLRVALVILALGVFGGGVYFFIIARPKNPTAVIQASRSPTTHTMNGERFDGRFFEGDSILVPLGQEQIKLELHRIADTVAIRTPDGNVALDLGEEVEVDLGDSGTPDLRISVVDFEKNNADMGVRLHFESIKGITAQDGDTLIVTSQSSSMVIINSPTAYPFTLQTNFQGYCMFRWEILMERDRRERNERYFQRSDELNIQAQNGIRIWTSNAQAAKFQVIGGGRTYPVEIGGAGEVVVADIRWVRDEDNRYRLVLARLETGS